MLLVDCRMQTISRICQSILCILQGCLCFLNWCASRNIGLRRILHSLFCSLARSGCVCRLRFEVTSFIFSGLQICTEGSEFGLCTESCSSCLCFDCCCIRGSICCLLGCICV